MQDPKSEFHEPPARGFGRLKHDSASTVAELREFLSQLRGKGPRDVVATISGNSLVKSTFGAAIAIALLLFVVSAAVYFATPEKSKSADAKPNAAVESSALKTPDGTNDEANADNVIDPKVATGTGDKTLEMLGVGETKIAPPDENPLDKKLEDLLNKKID